MKKQTILFLTFIFLFFYTPKVWALPVIPSQDISFASGRHVSGYIGDTQLTGRIPSVKGLGSSRFEQALNDAIEAVHIKKSATGSKDGASTVNFDYKLTAYGDFRSVLLYTTTISGLVSKNEVTTFNFNSKTNQIIDITDVMGPNAVAMANRFINDVMRSDPIKYDTDFKGITATHDFYVQNGEIVFLFNNHQLSTSGAAIQTLSMHLSNISTVTVSKSNHDYVIEPNYNLRMVSLRVVADALGYAIHWNNATRTATISKDDFSTSVTVGQNRYAAINFANRIVHRELEAPPEIRRQRIFVPISFFEVVLGTFYTVDENLDIIFSQYNHQTGNK